MGAKCAWAVLLAAVPALWAQAGPGNMRFEEGESGAAPPQWAVPTPNTSAVVTDAGCLSGKCVQLSFTPGGAVTFGNIMKSFPAEPYRGQAVTLRSAVRVKPGCRAQMWLRVDLPNGVMGFFDNMGDRPITLTEWKTYAIRGEIAPNAERVNFGVMVLGACTAWIDEASFETAKLAPLAVEPPRALTNRGAENLTAFARLYGYVRFFYPGDAAAKANWEALAVEGVRKVEGAADAPALAARLNSIFQPVAPEVRVAAEERERRPTQEPKAASYVRWVHHGFGGGAIGQIYRSERVVVRAADAPPPLRARLPGGVGAVVPTALPYDRDTVEKFEPPEPLRATAKDRATRLADAIIAWNVLQHFYPYFDVVQTDWAAELEPALRAAATDTDELQFLDTLRRLVAALHDGHGNVFLQGDPRRLAPLPVALGWIEGQLVVTAVAPDVRGVKPGDALASIDGTPAEKLLADAEALISAATPQWRRQKAVSMLGAGAPGSEAALEIRPLVGEARKVALARTPKFVQEPRPANLSEVEPGIWYVDINVLTADDWAKAIPSLEKARGIVIDFRGYPGNLHDVSLFFGVLSDKPMTSAQWHVPNVTAPDHAAMQFDRSGEWQLHPAQPQLKAKKAFLTDARAISYAESCMGIVEAYKLGEIVGGPTAGTNGNVNPFTLPGGYRVMWTGMKVLKHDGSPHHGVGILPTIPVSRTRAGVAAGKDEILERGIAAVR